MDNVAADQTVYAMYIKQTKKVCPTIDLSIIVRNTTTLFSLNEYNKTTKTTLFYS